MRTTRSIATCVAVVSICVTARGGHAQQTADSLRLSRRQAIAEALSRNAQLEIARERTAEARARRAIGIAVPDPSLSAAYDQATGPFSFGGAGSRPVSLGLAIPFPDKFRLNNRIGTAGHRGEPV